MRILLVLFLVFGSGILHAQNNKPPFSVRYLSGCLLESDILQISSFIKNHRYHQMPNYELVVTDTAAYIHSYRSERERNEKPLGSRFRSHNIYIDFRLQKEFNQSQPVGLGRYQVETSYRSEQFDLLKDSMVILGYTCYKAVPVNNKASNRRYYWYAPALPYSLSVFGFTSLPGLVLASEHWSHNVRMVTIAQLIEPETRKLIKPSKGTHIGADEFERLLSDLRNNTYSRISY